MNEQQPPKKLLDQLRDALRLKHYSYMLYAHVLNRGGLAVHSLMKSS